MEAFKFSKPLRLLVDLLCVVYIYRPAFNNNASMLKTLNSIYCMKPPNIKAPKCTLFSIQCFIFQGQRSQALTGLATAHCEHRWGQLTLESPFRIVESG